MKSLNRPAVGILDKLKTSGTRQIIIDTGSVDRALLILKKYLKSEGETPVGERIRRLIEAFQEQCHDVNPDDLRNLESELVDSMISILRANLGGVFTQAHLEQLKE